MAESGLIWMWGSIFAFLIFSEFIGNKDPSTIRKTADVEVLTTIYTIKRFIYHFSQFPAF